MWNSAGIETVMVDVEGVNHEVPEGSPFGESLRNLARNSGLSKFIVILNGVRVSSPSEAPATIVTGMTIKILREEKLG